MAEHKTRDLYLAALAMSLGMTLSGGDREDGDRRGPMTFVLMGPVDVWEKCRLAFINDAPIPVPVLTFARSVRLLKTYVHD